MEPLTNPWFLAGAYALLGFLVAGGISYLGHDNNPDSNITITVVFLFWPVVVIGMTISALHQGIRWAMDQFGNGIQRLVRRLS